MAYSTFFIIRQILMGLLIFTGAHMLFVKLAEQLKDNFYCKSFRIMGLAFLIIPISCFIYTMDNKLDIKPYISTAISLTANYTTFVLMSVSFLILLGQEFSKKLIVISSLAILLYPIPLWCSIAIGNTELINTVITASYAYFVIMVILLATYILYSYRKASQNIDNFYSEDVMICVRWISKSIKLLIGLAITSALAPIFFTYPYWLRCIFMVYGVLCYIYIYYGYRGMLMNLSLLAVQKDYDISLISKIERINEDKTALNPDTKEYIKEQLTLWIEQRQYLRRDITIVDVAKDINTNRTYLSKYINTEHKCSFRTWMTMLRHSEAKRLLSEHPELSIGDIAKKIGSASLESFTHIFSRYEGQSPSKWRENHIN